MATKSGVEEYEDINIDIKDNSIDRSTNGSEIDELQALAKQLSSDYSTYFKINTNLEKKETDDSIEDLLTHLEEFCGLLEMIKNDNNICLEQVLMKVHEKSLSMNQVYDKIDKLEQFVEIVKKCVDEMEEEMTKAEQLFGNNKVKRFLSSFISNTSSKQTSSQRKAKYEPKEIFKTSDYVKESNSEPDEQTSDLPKIDSNNE